MTVLRCRFPGCGQPRTGDTAVFCPDHHFACARVEASLLVGVSVRLKRARSDDERRHLAEQLDSYTRIVIRHIQERKGDHSVA